jgi:hypothetical protein
MSSYHSMGVQARLVGELPVKLVVVDHQVTLLGMDDPGSPEAGYPIFLFVEHAGYAALSADAFEQRWASGIPVEAASLPLEGMPATPEGVG